MTWENTFQGHKHKFEVRQEPLNVTSRNRPNTSWKVVDKAGHVHRWYDKETNQPATGYSPSKKYGLPSLQFVKEGVKYYTDGSEYDIGHHECTQCGEEISTSGAYTCDKTPQYIAGVSRFFIDDEEVTKKEFHYALEEEKRRYNNG